MLQVCCGCTDVEHQAIADSVRLSEPSRTGPIHFDQPCQKLPLFDRYWNLARSGQSALAERTSALASAIGAARVLETRTEQQGKDDVNLSYIQHNGQLKPWKYTRHPCYPLLTCFWP